MEEKKTINVCVIGAGSTYGIFLVKWALQLKHFPESNREKISVPPIGNISYSNTTERNKDLVLEVLDDDLSRIPAFASANLSSIIKNVHGYTNWREMIQKESPDLVVICSPLQTHVPYIRELLSDFHVKHILCEPPICHLDEIQSLPKIVDLAKEKNVTIGMNQQYAVLYDYLQGLSLNPQDSSNKTEKCGDLLTGLTGAEIIFITHGTHLWRKMQGVGEQEILEDLGAQAYELIPKSFREQKVTVKNVKKEGDNLFLNFVDYELSLGSIPLKITLGYHRKLKSLKMILKKGKKNYEFHFTGTHNPETGEFSRWIEGKNYAYPFKHMMNTDLVKSSFIASLAGKPIVPIEEGIKNLEFIRTLHSR